MPRGYDEMFNIIIMLVVAIVFSVTMGGPWGVIKDAANVTESRELIPFLIYVVYHLGTGSCGVSGSVCAGGAGIKASGRRPGWIPDL